MFPSLTLIEDECAKPAVGLTAYPCAALRNVTIEGLEPYLRYAGRRSGLDIGISWGAFDNILQDATAVSSSIAAIETRLVIVALWLPAFSELLGFKFAAASAEEISAECNRVRHYCDAAIKGLRSRTGAPILWLSFEPPAWPSYGIADASVSDGHRQTVARLNADVVKMLAEAGNAFAVDMGQCLERVGARAFYDWRYWHLARAPFSRAGSAEIAGELAKYVRALSGRTRKCLVLDCDNTLWGGIVGEDGVAGLRIGSESGGSAFTDFQREILNLSRRGVLLAICSKNNEADVLEVFRSRHEMVLKETDFAAIRVNWHDKAANLREIAHELGIGVDSLVLADDSAFEIELVASTLPEVETILLDGAAPAEHRGRIVATGLFDTLAITEEDRARGAMYQAEKAREALRGSVPDLEAYLRSLDMRAIVFDMTADDLDRAAQLCQRTNQFNLTSRRHTRDHLAVCLGSPSHRLLMLKLADRLGDYGTVGFCMVAIDGSEAVIDTFLMSCRVLGRGVETAFLAVCAGRATETGANTIRGSFVPSRKNAQVADFYPRHGFVPTGTTGGEQWFDLTWREGLLTIPEHLAVIVRSTVPRA